MRLVHRKGVRAGGLQLNTYIRITFEGRINPFPVSGVH